MAKQKTAPPCEPNRDTILKWEWFAYLQPSGDPINIEAITVLANEGWQFQFIHHYTKLDGPWSSVPMVQLVFNRLICHNEAEDDGAQTA